MQAIKTEEIAKNTIFKKSSLCCISGDAIREIKSFIFLEFVLLVKMFFLFLEKLQLTF